MSTGTLSRRLLLGTGAAAVVLGGGSIWACERQSAARMAQFDRLDVVLADLVDAPRIGRQIRVQVGLAGLCNLAEADARLATAMAYDCATTRRSWLHRAMRDDFAKGRIVLCDRLVLSETECLIAGLRFDAPGGLV